MAYGKTSKFLISIHFLLAANISYAAAIKLECPVTVKTEFSSGNVESSSDLIILDIETANGHTTIIGSGESPISASTRKLPSVTEVINSSDSGKWEIFTKSPKIEHSIRIDRHTGRLFYQSFFSTSSGRTLTTTITGICQKIDQSQRKF